MEHAGAPARPTTDPRRILVLAREHIGDLVCTTPALRALRIRYPAARITLVAGSRGADVLAHNPNFDELIRRPSHQYGIGLAAFIASMRVRRFDLAVILDDSADMALHTWLSGIPIRVGLVRKPRFAHLLTDRIPLDRGAHEMVDNFARVVAAVGADASGIHTEVYPSEADEAAAAAALAAVGIAPGERLAGINPGASFPANRWPPERFAELCGLLPGGLRPVLLGGPGDEPIASAIADACASRPAMLTGRLTILQLAAALRCFQVVITGDTGPMHIAVAVGTPVIALFGPADPIESGPGYAPGNVVIRNVDGCPLCTKRHCTQEGACMRLITAAEVADAVAALVQPGTPAP